MDTENTTNGSDNGNALVLYSRFKGDMERAIQKASSFAEIEPENRVVVDGGMYVAKCTQLKIESSGIQGILRLDYYSEIIKPETNSEAMPTSGNMVGMIMKKFFSKATHIPEEARNKISIAHEGKEYAKTWSEQSSQSRGWITLREAVHGGEMGALKAKLINDKELILSNEFLTFLFQPIMGALLELHDTLSRL